MNNCSGNGGCGTDGDNQDILTVEVTVIVVLIGTTKQLYQTKIKFLNKF
jgi:hypothetical protein